MADVTTVVEQYIAVFNEGDAERRRALIAETWSEDASYLDPLMSGDGRVGIDEMIAGVQQQFPGHRFELAGVPDEHHGHVRFAWHLVDEQDGSAVATGIDFGTLASDGRLRSIVGFLGPAAG